MTTRHRLWIVFAACVAMATAVFCWSYLSHLNEKFRSTAEDEVYEAVIRDTVRDVVTRTDGQANISQLVFDDTVLTDFTTGADVKSCQESVRKRLRLAGNITPPFNSLADKVYRILHGGDDGSLRADTIQDFLERSCTAGRLSETFHTDLPRTFINPRAYTLTPSLEQLFPGAGGIISLSHVGFDSTRREAIVSVSFVCDGLCGSGQRYILRKKLGRWEVVSKLMVWVSWLSMNAVVAR